MWFKRAVLILTLLLMSFPVMGAEFHVRVGSQGWIVNKPVMTMKEMRFKDIVRQRTDFSCGAAALATVLKHYYGRTDIGEEEIVQWLLRNSDEETIRRQGFSLLDLKRYALDLGYRAEGYRVTPEQLEKINLPTIILLTVKGYSHFVVLKGVKGKKAYIADPALGRRTITLTELAESWNGLVFAVFGQDRNPDYDLFSGAPTVTKSEVWRLNDLMMRNLFINPSEFIR